MIPYGNQKMYLCQKKNLNFENTCRSKFVQGLQEYILRKGGVHYGFHQKIHPKI